MNTPKSAQRHNAVGPEPASSAETLSALIARAKREETPLLKAFVQNPDRSLSSRAAPLSDFVHRGDLRALKALLLSHTIISNGDGNNGWSTTLPLGVWARALGATETATVRTASTAASKILTRLEQRKLIERRRQGRERKVTVTLLRPDGTGDPYTRPGKGNKDPFLKLDTRYWTDDWHNQLDLPSTAMLLVALHEKPGFTLATERMPEWYGWSADTAERGFRGLANHGLLKIEKRVKKAPLSPTGLTAENVYTLCGPFEQGSQRSTNTQGNP